MLRWFIGSASSARGRTIGELTGKQHPQEPSIADGHIEQHTWKGELAGLAVKFYAPQRCSALRHALGVSLEMLAESFLDTASTAADVGGRRLGTVKRRGVFSKEEDQILLAPAGPFVAKTISRNECRYLATVAGRVCEHFQDCHASLMPRFYAIVRIDKGGRVRSTEYWVVTDNINDLPLPVQMTFDLKGVRSRQAAVDSCSRSLVVLKEGNLPTFDNKGKKVQRLPQVSPWAARQLLEALATDCCILDELKATNYSLLVLVCPPRGEVEEMFYGQGYPRRPPYIRLDGPDCTLFAMLVDCWQEWKPAKQLLNVLGWFKRPSMAAEPLALAPSRYSQRLLQFLESALGEGQDAKEVYRHEKWSDAVRTKAAVKLTPHALEDSGPLEGVVHDIQHSGIRPLSLALQANVESHRGEDVNIHANPSRPTISLAHEAASGASSSSEPASDISPSMLTAKPLRCGATQDDRDKGYQKQNPESDRLKEKRQRAEERRALFLLQVSSSSPPS